jgi:hypothetical protein
LGRKGQAAIIYVEIIENKMITAEIVDDKSSILDVRALTGVGERVNIEVQLRNPGAWTGGVYSTGALNFHGVWKPTSVTGC